MYSFISISWNTFPIVCYCDSFPSQYLQIASLYSNKQGRSIKTSWRITLVSTQPGLMLLCSMVSSCHDRVDQSMKYGEQTEILRAERIWRILIGCLRCSPTLPTIQKKNPNRPATSQAAAAIFSQHHWLYFHFLYPPSLRRAGWDLERTAFLLPLATRVESAALLPQPHE